MIQLPKKNPKHNKRESDKRWYKRYLYALTGVYMGWALKSYYPDQTLVMFFGSFYHTIIYTINSLGGLAVVTTSIVAFTTLYRKVKK